MFYRASTMTVFTRLLVSVAASVALVGAAVAQVQAPAAPASDMPRVDERQHKQHQRIRDGVKDGELTRHEAHRMRREQRRIAIMERRAEADGVVTRRERAKLHAAQDAASRDIHRQKHDQQTRPAASAASR